MSNRGTPFYIDKSKGTLTMPKTLHIRTTVQSGGKVEIVSPELEPGQTVDVVVGSTDY